MYSAGGGGDPWMESCSYLEDYCWRDDYNIAECQFIEFENTCVCPEGMVGDGFRNTPGKGGCEPGKYIYIYISLFNVKGLIIECRMPLRRASCY